MYQIRLYLKNKILSKYSDDGKIIYHYKILIISDTYIFQCVKLYDSNHIKVNTDSYSYSGFYFNVVPSQITFKKIEPNSKLYHLLSNSILIRDIYMTQTENHAKDNQQNVQHCHSAN